jgi:rhodanese-like protein
VRRRALLTVSVAGALLLGAAGPAAPPDYPVTFIKVDTLKALKDKGTTVDVIDVRAPAQFAEMHIDGARSIPLGTVTARAGEISKTGRVVLY